MTTKKIDALLDTIDNELSDLETIVDAQRPVTEETQPVQDRGSRDLGNETLPFEDVDEYWNSDEAPDGLEIAPESVDRATDSALDAISDAEDEVNAMLSSADNAEDSGVSAVPVREADAGDGAADKALEELLSTREVDASALLNNAPVHEESETDADDEQLLDNLFSEMEITVEPDENSGRLEEPAAFETELPRNALDDSDLAAESIEELPGDSEAALVGQGQSHDLKVESTVAVDEDIDASGPGAPTSVGPLSDTLLEDLKLESEVTVGEEIDAGDPDTLADEDQLDDLLVDPKSEVEAEENTKTDSTESSIQAESTDELADLISKKVEALVMRLVEERLPELADRIISERFKVIFNSMDKSVKS